jgi:ABC-2 type transport system permease protein
MTTTSSLREPAPGTPHRLDEQGVLAQPVSLPRVVRSEWIKFRTLRSSWVVLGAAVLAMILFGIIIANNTRHPTVTTDPEDLGQSATLQGYYLAQLLMGALGVLFVSAEFSTGMIRSTFAAVPTRLPVLWAKMVVFASVVAVALVPACVVAYLAAQAVIAQSRPAFSLSDPGVLRVVIGTGVYLTLIGLLGGAIGWIVRSTPGALVTQFGLMLVLPVLAETVLGNWGRSVGKFLPTVAGSSFISLPAQPQTLAPWTGLALLVAWVVVVVAVAAVMLRRRDA